MKVKIDRVWLDEDELVDLEYAEVHDVESMTGVLVRFEASGYIWTDLGRVRDLVSLAVVQQVVTVVSPLGESHQLRVATVTSTIEVGRCDRVECRVELEVPSESQG